MKRQITIVIGVFVVVVIIIGLGNFVRFSPGGQVIVGPPSLVLAYPDGREVMPDDVMLDGESKGSITEIILSGLEHGDHDIVIIINGIRYDKTFSYDGESLIITVEKPVESSVFVLSSEESTSLENVKIYSDAEYKCQTDNNGVCTFFEKPGKHMIKLQGTGLFKEELKTISKDSHSFTFYVERKFEVKVKVIDKDTHEAIKNAYVEVDGIIKGSTNSNGEITIQNIKEGMHAFEAKFETVSENEAFEVKNDNQLFTIYLQVPRKIMLTINDEETGSSVDGVRMYFGGKEVGSTTQDGTIEIEDVLPGNYKITVDTSMGIRDAKYIDVISSRTSYSTTVDMPNPLLKPTATMEWNNILGTKVRCKIKAINIGDDITKGPVALCLVYEIIDDKPVLKGSDSVLFSNIAPNSESKYEETEYISVPWNPLTAEEIVVVFFDTHEYLQSKEQSIEMETTPSFAAQVLSDVYGYCSSNPEECAKIAGAFVGSLLK